MNQQPKYFMTFNTIILLMWLVAMVDLGLRFTHLPTKVATHFTLLGEADEFAPKESLWFLPITFLLIWGVMVVMIWTAPKMLRTIKGENKSSRKFQIFLALGFYIINVIAWAIYMYQLYNILHHRQNMMIMMMM